MDKWQAINDFWSGFGIPAYEQASVPTDAKMPYISYNAQIGALDEVLNLSASIWFYGTTWEPASKLADQIAAAIGYGYKITTVDGGYFWIHRGNPFAQRMSDEDPMVKRIYINIQAEFLTAY